MYFFWKLVRNMGITLFSLEVMIHNLFRASYRKGEKNDSFLEAMSKKVDL